MPSTLALARLPRPAPGAWRRAILAGGAWGLSLGLGLAAWRFAQCGLVCPAETAVTTLVAVGAGIVTIGPLAAFGAPSEAPPARA